MASNDRKVSWKCRAAQLRRETYAVYLAYRDPRVPWYAKALAAGVIGYAFSPIDLIPDFIPILGYLDDLLLIPMGVGIVLKLIPADVMAECRQKAQQDLAEGQPTNWVAAGAVVALWLFFAALAVFLGLRVAQLS